MKSECVVVAEVILSEEPQPKRGREEQLLQLAKEYFSRGGFRETSLQQIADELGITRPLFYYYFESKDALLWRLIGDLGDGLLERARPLVREHDDPVEAISRVVRAHTVILLENLAAFKIYFAERHSLEGALNDQLLAGEKEYRALFRDVIRKGQERGLFRTDDANTLAHLVLGLANSPVRWYLPSGPLNADGLSLLVADMTLSALVGRPKARPRKRSQS